jgi:D-alanine-D-alanine ligase
MGKKNILLICGGGGSEHEVSLVSANYIKSNLEKLDDCVIYYVVINKDGTRTDDKGNLLELRRGGLHFDHATQKETLLHFAIPCFHGAPGETGDIQAVFEMMELPYFGCGPEASRLCFNKISTKLWFDALSIPNTPYLFIEEPNEANINKAVVFYKNHKTVYVKASNQGSSVGCYFVENEEQLKEAITNAFKLSPYVLIETNIEGRELEIAVFEYDNKVIATVPGEIVCDSQFYDYEQKYSENSKAMTLVEAENINQEDISTMKDIAVKAFKQLKLRHLSRIDFFLAGDGTIYVNEINTFPGMTPISMFPKMLVHTGLEFHNYLKQIIETQSRE